MRRALAVALAVVLAVVGCRGTEPGQTPAPAEPSAAGPVTAPATAAPADAPVVAPAADPGRCTRRDFASTIDLAEASGAVYLPAEGDAPAHVVVVSDSGNRGAFVVVDATTGAELGRGALPLDRAASDDLEGLARAGDTYVALTSAGFARHFRRVGLARFERTADAYPIAAAGRHDDLVCTDARRGNCGRNWEGLCLASPPPTGDACAGFAASKRDGELVCLVWRGGRLAADPDRVIAVARREALTGCEIVSPDELWVGNNLFGAAAVARVTGWADPATATVTALGPAGSGFPEAIAAGPDGAVFRFSDLASRPSAADRFDCGPPARAR